MESRIKKNLVWLILCAFLLLDLVFRVWAALSNGVIGDGAMNAMVAREIAKTFQLQSHFPYFVTGEGTYFPVAYPQFYFVVMAVGYILGTEMGITLLAPIIGSLIVLAAFIYARKFFGSRVAFLAAFLLLGERHLFDVTTQPYMEGAVVLFSIIAMFQFLIYTSNWKKQDFALSSIFLGLLIATKQQGIIISLVLVVFVLMLIAKKMCSEKMNLIKVCRKIGVPFLLLMAISISIASPFLYFQILTTGTIDYPWSTGITRIFFKPKWIEDSESIEWIARRAEQRTTPLSSPLHVPAYFLGMPIGVSAEFYSVIFSFLTSILVILGVIYVILKRENHYFLLLLISLLAVHFPVMFYMNTTWRYFTILPVFSTIIAAVGASWIIERLARSNLPRISLGNVLGRIRGIHSRKYIDVLTITFVIWFLIIPTLVNLRANYLGNYRESDRTTGGYWPDRMTKVREAAEWLNDHATSMDIILVDRWNEVGYYSERNVLCINELGGHNIPKIYAANSPYEAIKYLREYNITYIWISQLQIDRSMYEWVPRHGLLDFIDFSPQHFRKVYQNDLIRIYEVLDPSEDSFILSHKHYYSNVLGDFDDVYFISPIVVEPEDKWRLDVSRGREFTSDGEPGYIRVYINQEELWVKGAKSQLRSNSPLTLVLYYWDNFTSNVYIDINGTEQYRTISSINGDGNNQLKWNVIEIKNLEYSILFDELSYPYIKFRVRNTSSFTLQMVLLVPELMNITDNMCEDWASWILGEGGEYTR